MAHRVLTEIVVSITEHKKNPMAIVAAGEGMALAMPNRNEPTFNCVPAKAYEELMDLVDDWSWVASLMPDWRTVRSRCGSALMPLDLALHPVPRP
jgi:antitoxin StbD